MDRLRACADCKQLYPATAAHFSRNRRRKDGLVLWCKACAAKRWQAHYKLNREKLIARAVEGTRKRRQRPEVAEANCVAAREAKRALLADPVARAAHRKRTSDWVKANPERAKQFKHAQPAWRAHRGRMREERVRRATPPWVNVAAIRAVYEEAARVTLATGVPHEVDHIVPLGGRNVCGLHVPWNLRVITAEANRLKNNTFVEELALS